MHQPTDFLFQTLFNAGQRNSSVLSSQSSLTLQYVAQLVLSIALLAANSYCASQHWQCHVYAVSQTI